jgi:predicted cation transporter
MNQSQMIVAGLGCVIAIVLLAPFLSRKIEEQLEAFLFVMGVASVSISSLWSWHLVGESLIEPVKISLAVLLAGFAFRAVRPKIRGWTAWAVSRVGYGPVLFVLVAGLGLLSSVITAIIAALVLAEVITALNLARAFEVRVVIVSCFAIGLGATLTPLGEPLATIAIARLAGEPYHAGFFFLLNLLGIWIIPLILGLAIWMALSRKPTRTDGTLSEDKPESYVDIVWRAMKVYLFVMALVLLGTGFGPVVDRYLTHVSAGVLYWVNSVSAILDNATLTAAEITPSMSLAVIKSVLLGLLIAGGMLIPGNIPNIICAGKLGIKSKEWAVVGLPLGLAIMLGVFIIQLVV